MKNPTLTLRRQAVKDENGNWKPEPPKGQWATTNYNKPEPEVRTNYKPLRTAKQRAADKRRSATQTIGNMLFYLFFNFLFR